ncbi:MAG TPA: DNA polymerase III subunit delta [Sandaracinaceae bacterium LLY-WYZ-13_1]|nr:DNA polymerase III subunit delta [Sandaracinaceae bacterium LLY-WYZ-13_1]
MARASRASGRDIFELVERARTGSFDPVHVLVGSERFLIERAVGLLRRASLGDGPAGFNDDLFHGSAQLDGERVVSAARTLPMMASARFVLVRDVDGAPAKTLERLATYVAEPAESTCLVLTAEKLHGQSKLVKAAKKAKALWDAKPLKGGALRRFANAEAERRGHALTGPAAEALIEALGDDLAALDDAVERLSLYVGAGQRIDPAAVQACVSRIAADSIWTLVDAVGMRDTRRALGAASSLLADREPPLRILAMVARQLRIVAKMREALASGKRGKEATQEAGAPPFKARELTESARRFTARQLGTAFATLADADLALKGSKRPPERVLEEAILQLCTGRERVRARIPRRQRTYR